MNIPSGTCALGKKGCFTDGKCYYNRNCENKVVTHADRIRAMSDEGIAKHFAAMFVEQKKLDAVESGKDLSYTLCGVLEDAFYSMLLRHLKQPAKEEEDDADTH